MKTINYLLATMLLILQSFFVGAEQFTPGDTITNAPPLPESAYQLEVPKQVTNINSPFVPYLLFGIVIAAILYVSYRYWSDNREPSHG